MRSPERQTGAFGVHQDADWPCGGRGVEKLLLGIILGQRCERNSAEARLTAFWEVAIFTLEPAPTNHRDNTTYTMVVVAFTAAANPPHPTPSRQESGGKGELQPNEKAATHLHRHSCPQFGWNSSGVSEVGREASHARACVPPARERNTQHRLHVYTQYTGVYVCMQSDVALDRRQTAGRWAHGGRGMTTTCTTLPYNVPTHVPSTVFAESHS